MTIITHAVDRQKWQNMAMFDQMGNIYSEVGRSIKAWQAGDQPQFEAALTRALDLFDATVEGLIRQKSSRAKEVLRARDQYLSLFYAAQPTTDQELAALNRYFFNFAAAART